MLDAISAQKQLREIRNMDILVEARDYTAKCNEPAKDVDPSADAICHTMLFATDVLRRTILAVHDAEEARREYNP